MEMAAELYFLNLRPVSPPEPFLVGVFFLRSTELIHTNQEENQGSV